MVRWEFVMLHHSLTKDGQTVSWDAIRKYHVETNGWKDIGYHYGIELINARYEVIAGRMLNQPGAHCVQRGMNGKAIGVCVVGNFDLEAPSGEQLKLAARLVKSLMEEFRIPVTHVVGHRDYAPKSCPGKLFDLDQFRGRL